MAHVAFPYFPPPPDVFRTLQRPSAREKKLTKQSRLHRKTLTRVSHSKVFKTSAHGMHTDKRACTRTKGCYSFIHSFIPSASSRLPKKKERRDLRGERGLWDDSALPPVHFSVTLPAVRAAAAPNPGREAWGWSELHPLIACVHIQHNW